MGKGKSADFIGPAISISIIELSLLDGALAVCSSIDKKATSFRVKNQSALV